MKLPPVIGFAGRKGHGKDTAVRQISALAPGEVYTLRMADPLKRALVAMGFTPEQVDGAQKEAPIEWLDGVTPRHVMQTMGDDWGRKLIHPDLWIILWRRHYQDVRAQGGRPFVIAVPDVRYPNELALIRQLGGCVLWIERPGMPDAGAHASENSLQAANCDGWLLNDGEPADLRARLRVWLEQEYGA